MKFFQVFVLITMVLSTFGVVAEKPEARKGLVALFATAGTLFLASVAVTSII